MRAMRMVTFLVALAGAWPAHSDAQRIESYSGSCDASAGISLSGDIFVVGNDENNTLHFYRRGQPAPIGTLPLSTFLGTGSNEADIEGATADRLANLLDQFAQPQQQGQAPAQSASNLRDRDSRRAVTAARARGQALRRSPARPL